MVRRVVVVALAAAVSLSACADLSFRIDRRLHFLTPRDRQVVTVPFTLRWSMTSFEVVGPGEAAPTRHAGYFAVFVDRAPVHPGQSVKAVASGDHQCKLEPGCPDTQYLADHRVYTTTHPWFTLTEVPLLAGSRDKLQLHQVTVVLLDAAGRRIGESAWTRQFKMRRMTL
jgi:hypothetical protein